MANTSFKWLALLGGLAVGAVTAAFAQDSGPLIDALVKKGILNDQEAEELRVDLQKDFAESSAGKLSLSSSLKELKLSGDARVRYEYRGGVANANKNDQYERERFRYRFRLGLTGKYGDGWFFGSRLETAPGNRSTNVTSGNYTNSAFAKNGDNTIYVGQLYIGRTVDDFTVTAGRMPNPIVSTSMVWDGDINPEGLAEQWSHTSGDFTWIANVGQFIYDDGNPENAFGSASTDGETYLFAFQGGGKVKFSNGSSLQILPTYYTYSGTTNDFTALTGAGQNASLRTYGLSIIEIPAEFAFKLGSLPAKVWVDLAYNLDADERATKAGHSSFGGEDTAYQIGFGVGQTKAKGDWEAKVFYQYVEAFALDSNLVDSDIFDSRTNMKGFVLNASYVFSAGVTGTITYANGKVVEDGLPTYGSGDISPASNILTDYQLLQVDLNIKF